MPPPPPRPPPPPPAEKTKEQRLTDTISILKKLQEIGIPDTEPGYIAAKEHMSRWVAEGGGAVYTIQFPRFGRKGELTLPRRADRTASLHLKGGE